MITYVYFLLYHTYYDFCFEINSETNNLRHFSNGFHWWKAHPHYLCSLLLLIKCKKSSKSSCWNLCWNALLRWYYLVKKTVLLWLLPYEKCFVTCCSWCKIWRAGPRRRRDSITAIHEVCIKYQHELLLIYFGTFELWKYLINASKREISFLVKMWNT